MANLNFKTRGGASPQGKPRVYFTCHPDDFKVFFEEISEEILSRQNCAIYYYDDLNAEIDDETLKLDLGQMQLFVMPVTTKLLTKENTSISRDFAFAMENHIPVLPLMQEDGLADIFKSKCGDLQYLAKHNDDPTAISYEEKLTKYLESVLIGDEMAEKVRAEFDAYVFLSYRKKDRKYAQELMRLIHKNEFCRDIAIWYDEFLTPGEDFNESIQNALEKSELFALTVTPFLLERHPDGSPNYIMRTEYPMAKESGKPVVPVEMEATDKEKLSEEFDGIGECASKDEQELAKALLAAVERLNNKENDNSPEHQFFIGLAYLGGIDVEVDHERALKMITSAAEAGLPEALEKLISMYETGEGVERNYHTGIEWRQKLVEVYKQIIESKDDADEQDYLNYFNELWHLGDAFKSVGKLQPAKEVYGRMNKELLEIPEERFNWLERYVSISYEKLGDIAEAEGKLTEAKEYYLKYLEISELLTEETGTVEARIDLSISYNRLGNIAKAEGKLTEAKEYYLKAFEIKEQLTEETGTVRARRDLSISYEKLGNIAEAEGKLTEAKEYYLKAFEIDKQLAEETGTVSARRELSISYNKLGDIANAEGKLTEAKEYYLKSLEISEQLAEETGTVEARRDLSISYDNLGDIFKAEGNLTEAKEYYLKDLEIAEQLAEETGTVEARRDISISYNRLGDIANAKGKLTEAKEYYLKGLEIFEQLAEEIGTVEARRDLLTSYNNLGNIMKYEGDFIKASEYYLKFLEISEQLARETRTVQSYDDLAVSYCKVGYLDESSPDIDMIKKARDIYKMLSDNCPNVKRYRDCLRIVENALA